MRELNKKLISYLEAKLAANGLYQNAVKEKNARQIVWLAATALVGIKEKSGKNDGEMVNLIQDTVGGMEQWPWCMSLVQSCIAFAEYKTGVKSPVVASEHCVTVWNKTTKTKRVKDIPLAGAIAIWQDTGKQTGHTEIVLSADESKFQCVGGNTSGTTKPNEEVNREGNGVFYTSRSYASTKKRKLLGFIKPF